MDVCQQYPSLFSESRKNKCLGHVRSRWPTCSDVYFYSIYSEEKKETTCSLLRSKLNVDKLKQRWMLAAWNNRKGLNEPGSRKYSLTGFDLSVNTSKRRTTGIHRYRNKRKFTTI